MVIFVKKIYINLFCKILLYVFCSSLQTSSQGEYGLVSGPYDLLVNNSGQDVCIHLHSLQAAAYSLLIPLPTVKNYLRLVSLYMNINVIAVINN